MFYGYPPRDYIPVQLGPDTLTKYAEDIFKKYDEGTLDEPTKTLVDAAIAKKVHYAIEGVELTPEFKKILRERVDAYVQSPAHLAALEIAIQKSCEDRQNNVWAVGQIVDRTVGQYLEEPMRLLAKKVVDAEIRRRDTAAKRAAGKKTARGR